MSEEWHKSSYSKARGECVEVADSTAATLVRDSTYPHRGFLTFPTGEWRAFVSSLKDNELGG